MTLSVWALQIFMTENIYAAVCKIGGWSEQTSLTAKNCKKLWNKGTSECNQDHVVESVVTKSWKISVLHYEIQNLKQSDSCCLCFSHSVGNGTFIKKTNAKIN